MLAAARHPGVVELVGVEGSADRPVLMTTLVVGPTLATPIPLSAGEVADMVGGLASTLADLHEMGIVHGAVTAEHVIVGPDGRPVLCGFGSAGRVGEASPGGDVELQPSTDVAALGRLLRRIATGPEARVLRRIAEAAMADDPGAMPSARDLAAQLATAVPGDRLPVATPPASAVSRRPTSDHWSREPVSIAGGSASASASAAGDRPPPSGSRGHGGSHGADDDGARDGPGFLGTDRSGAVVARPAS